MGRVRIHGGIIAQLFEKGENLVLDGVRTHRLTILTARLVRS